MQINLATVSKAVQGLIEMASDRINSTRFARINAIKNSNNMPSSQRLDRNHVLTKVQGFQGDKKELVASAALANYPYQQDLASVNLHAKGWVPNNDLAQKLADSSSSLELIKDKNLIVDKNSGLVATVFHNKNTNEVRLVFGGTTSGKAGGELAERSLKNAGNAATHWGANISNAAFDNVPKSYQQAAKLTELLSGMSKYDTTTLKHFTVSTSGHSKGGGEAAYAALMNSTEEQSIKAECFCSAEFGAGMQKELLKKFGSPEAVKTASAGIQHYLIKGDVVPHMHRLFSGLTNVGKSTTLKTDVPGENSALKRHDHFFKHIDQGLSTAVTTRVRV